MEKEQGEKIKGFIQSSTLAVLSTVTPNGTSESAVVEISALDDLKLVFDTLAVFRKYKNLKNNQNVSLVIGLEPATVQYEGIATELRDSELEEYKKLHLERFPEAAKFEKEDMRFFKVVPRWIRYTDISKQPWETFEITL